ncbi:MAG: DEAD/DEAH box helicase family protein, partial [Bacteroidota bacterium]
MSNFQFLEAEWPRLYKEAREVERLALVSPTASTALARRTLEITVHWLYDHDADLDWPYDTKLVSLIRHQDFRDILKPSMYREVDNIRRIGNDAAHSRQIKAQTAVDCLKYLFRFLSWLGKGYSRADVEIAPFRMELIPDGREPERSRKEMADLRRELEQSRAAEAKSRQALADQRAANETLRAKHEAEKQAMTQRRKTRARTQPPIPELVSEARTRKLYIDSLLRDAGWDQLTEGRELEYEVKGMPSSTNPSGIGYADYVLWGKDGKPLAVIEAKRTQADASQGKHQALLYADCLEQMHGQRPVIFYTNGFETYLWDDSFYNSREVYGFYTQEELQLLVDRRSTRKDIRQFKVNRAIAGREYQIEGIRRVAENLVVDGKSDGLRGARRECLLVMATGSGKTRTSAAIVEMLTKCNWVKRVLFLADRNALVKQAKKAFNEHLPELSAINLTQEKEIDGIRLVFSTYPTMLNQIDKAREGEERFYGVGHFDLIIIDEAHRSVYQKYGAIFEYFDALLIGLTATPKKD